MVVGMIVRVRNRSSRSFYLVRAGDPFYSPKIGGMPCDDEPFEVPPGFDESAEGLVVPWAATSRSGLLIGEEASPNVIRCVVGPSAADNYGKDWLRTHDDAWKPVAEKCWLPLGQRHLLGAVGGIVDIQLTFRDQRPADCDHDGIMYPPGSSEGDSASELDKLAECAVFEFESSAAPPSTVFLNVFDLASMASIPNQLLNNTIFNSLGAFHAALEVYGDEWGFYKQPNPDDCGICRSRQPRRHPVHVFRQSINLGMTKLKDHEVWNLIRREVLPRWPSDRYDLIHCNCIHFCDELSLLLGTQPLPSWVKGLHETGAALLRPITYLNSLTAPSTARSSERNLAEEAADSECDTNERRKEVETCRPSPSLWSAIFRWPSAREQGKNELAGGEPSIDEEFASPCAHEALGTSTKFPSPREKVSDDDAMDNRPTNEGDAFSEFLCKPPDESGLLQHSDSFKSIEDRN